MSGEPFSWDDIPQSFDGRAAMCLALEHDWNGYRAPPIDPATIDRARPLNERLEELGLSPWLTPMNNGGVALECAGPDNYMIEFEPDGTASFYCVVLSDEAIEAIVSAAATFLRTKPTPDV